MSQAPIDLGMIRLTVPPLRFLSDSMGFRSWAEENAVS